MEHNLICVCEGDERKTMFSTTRGNDKYAVMPFGLSNAPSAFYRRQIHNFITVTPTLTSWHLRGGSKDYLVHSASDTQSPSED